MKECGSRDLAGRSGGHALGRAIGALLSIILVGAFAAPTWAADTSEQDQDPCSSTMNIFMQEGASGSFVENGSGSYDLTIANVLPYTIYFADRPSKQSGFVPLDEYLAGFNWDPQDPPNAAIILREGDEDEDIVVTELTDPRYDAAAQTLQYSATVVDDYEANSQWLQQISDAADPSIPDTFGPVLLVIDDCPCLWAPAQGCDDHNYCNSTSWSWTHVACRYNGECCSKCYVAPEPSPSS